MNDKPNTFVSACLHFFGKKEGQTSTQFAAELKTLSPQDREEVIEGLIANGYPIATQ